MEELLLLPLAAALFLLFGFIGGACAKLGERAAEALLRRWIAKHDPSLSQELAALRDKLIADNERIRASLFGAHSEQGSVVASSDQDARKTHSTSDGVVEAVRGSAPEDAPVDGTIDWLKTLSHYTLVTRPDWERRGPVEAYRVLEASQREADGWRLWTPPPAAESPLCGCCNQTGEHWRGMLLVDMRAGDRVRVRAAGTRHPNGTLLITDAWMRFAGCAGRIEKFSYRGDVACMEWDADVLAVHPDARGPCSAIPLEFLELESPRSEAPEATS